MPYQMKSFLRWWRGELHGALPRRWLESLTGGLIGSLVGVRDQELVGYRVEAGVLREFSRVPLAGLDAAGAASALRRLVESLGGKPDHLALVLPPDFFVRKLVSLPSAAQENLRQVLGFELDRHTPFRASQARFSSRVLAHDGAQANIRVDLVAAPREKLDALMDKIAAMGGKVTAVFPEIGEPQWRDFNLHDVVGASAGTLGIFNRLNVALAGMFLVLLAAALAIPIWQKRQAAIELLPKLNAVRVESDRVRKLGAELEQMVADSNYIHGRKHTTVPASNLLEDLARVFPDDTWVMILEVKPASKQRELVLSGEAASATKVVELLDKVPYLKNPTFRSQLTKIPGQAAERFVIAAEIRPRSLPATVADAQNATATPVSMPATSPVAAPAQPQPQPMTGAAPLATAPQSPAGPAPATAPQVGGPTLRSDLKPPAGPMPSKEDVRPEKPKS
jgi:general secretion pathway protein L